MLSIEIQNINPILEAYGVSIAESFEELQRYNYEDEGEDAKHVRLILKAKLSRRFGGSHPLKKRKRRHA